MVSGFNILTEGGFDVGTVIIGDVEMTFWNEYMTLESGENRLYTFPDLIMTFDADTGMPLTTADIGKDANIIIIASKKENIKLGAGMFDTKLMAEIEPIVKKEILKYL